MANVIDFIAPDVQLGKNVYEISEAIEAWFMVLAVADVLWVEKNDAGDHIKKFTEPEMLVAKEEAIKTDESTFEFVMVIPIHLNVFFLYIYNTLYSIVQLLKAIFFFIVS